GELARLAMELVIRQDPRIAGLSFPHERRLILPRRVEMPVEAVVAHIGCPTHEPLGVRRLPVENAVPLREPVKLPCRLLGPKLLGILLTKLPEALIFGHRLDVGL